MTFQMRTAMLAGLFCASISFSSSDQHLFSWNDKVICAQGPALSSVTFAVEADHLIMQLKDRMGTGGYTTSTPSILDQARSIYGEIESQMGTMGAIGISLQCSNVGGQKLIAREDNVNVFHGASIKSEYNILIAQKKDVVFTAPTLSFQSTYSLTPSGHLVLKAPDNCAGWLRSLTFERAPGERPFDMMLQGEVSFDPPCLKDLIIAGASRVTFGVQSS